MRTITLCFLLFLILSALSPYSFVRAEDGDFKIGLALSGGSAWGIAHIGVLEVLEEHGIVVDIITGSSAGAIIGALYAGGVSTEEMVEIVSKLHWTDILALTRPDLGFFSTRGMLETIQEYLPIDDFADLLIQLAIVATDLERGEEYVFTEGSVSLAATASSALPILFNPVEYDGRLLVDGGVINNLPDRLAREMGADVVIAVNVSKNFSFEGRPHGQIETAIRAFNIMQGRNVRADDSDIEINPRLFGIRGSDFQEYEQIIERGREAALEHIYEILALLQEKSTVE